VEWLGPDNLAVTSIANIRLVLSNGSIYFPPFEAEVFRQDVHWAVYRCVVSNSVGTIVSRDVTVRAGKAAGGVKMTWIFNGRIPSVFLCVSYTSLFV
jgi:hypothetical protein